MLGTSTIIFGDCYNSVKSCFWKLFLMSVLWWFFLLTFPGNSFDDWQWLHVTGFKLSPQLQQQVQLADDCSTPEEIGLSAKFLPPVILHPDQSFPTTWLFRGNFPRTWDLPISAPMQHIFGDSPISCSHTFTMSVIVMAVILSVLFCSSWIL